MNNRIWAWLSCALCLAACVRPASSTSVAISSVPTVFPSPIKSLLQTSTIEIQGISATPASGSLITLQPPAVTGTPTIAPPQPPGDHQEHPVVLIPMEGQINQPEAEISGMAWFSGTLVLLPKFPDRFENQGGGSVFTIQKADLLSFLDGESSGPITPRAVPFYAPSIREHIPGFEGFESIVFSGDRVYLTIEARPEGMVSYLVSGWYEPGLEAIYIDPDRSATIEPQTQLPDLGDESLVPFGRRLATIYAANGTAVNPAPKAHLFGQDLSLTTELDFPYIEYHISDATPADDSGRFWVTNIFTPSDAQLQSILDPLQEMYGKGQTHSASSLVERLIELQFTEQGIVLAGTPPIQLELSADGIARDWSAIARLDQRGFLLATGGNPQTLLGFVPLIP